MQDIIDNADLQLKEAAAHLDASAVSRIERQRDAALRTEEQSYDDQRSQIEDTLQEQLDSIRSNMETRLEDLQEFHDLRQEREEEDRALRLQRMEEAHRRQLQELEDEERDRLQQLKSQYANERREREEQYIEERRDLTIHLGERERLEAEWREAVLIAEEAWWQARLNLVGGGTAGDGGIPGGDIGGGGTPGGGNQPSIEELRRLATDLAAAAGYNNDQLIALYAAIQHMTAPILADFIERTFGYDVPGYAMGTAFVPRTGLAMVHQGERIIPASDNRPGFGGITIQSGAIQITALPGMSEAALGRIFRRELGDFLEEMYS
jgi:hypothetical protein